MPALRLSHESNCGYQRPNMWDVDPQRLQHVAVPRRRIRFVRRPSYSASYCESFAPHRNTRGVSHTPRPRTSPRDHPRSAGTAAFRDARDRVSLIAGVSRGMRGARRAARRRRRVRRVDRPRTIPDNVKASPGSETNRSDAILGEPRAGVIATGGLRTSVIQPLRALITTPARSNALRIVSAFTSKSRRRHWPAIVLPDRRERPPANLLVGEFRNAGSRARGVRAPLQMRSTVVRCTPNRVTSCGTERARLVRRGQVVDLVRGRDGERYAVSAAERAAQIWEAS